MPCNVLVDFVDQSVIILIEGLIRRIYDMMENAQRN